MVNARHADVTHPVSRLMAPHTDRGKKFIMETLATMKPWVLFLGFFVLVLFSLEIGYLIGRKARRKAEGKSGEETGSAMMVKGAILTLFALLLGFSFAMASSRFDARRQLLV